MALAEAELESFLVLLSRDVGELVGVPRAFGGHSSRSILRASKPSAALWSKTFARCLAFSSGHTSTVDSVPSGSIRTTCHPKALASYRSRFILRICAPNRPFSSPELYHNQTDPLPTVCAPGGVSMGIRRDGVGSRRIENASLSLSYARPLVRSRAISGRSSVTVKKKRSAATEPLMLGARTPICV
jgi:hypothetical protein